MKHAICAPYIGARPGLAGRSAASPVQGDGGVLWQTCDDLHLELVLLEHCQRLFPAHHYPLESLLLLHYLQMQESELTITWTSETMPHMSTSVRITQ